jgi:DNA-3-methyladenine glycosylase II
MKFTFYPRPPFNFNLLKFFAWKEPSPEIYGENTWRRGLRINKEIFPVKVKSLGSVESPKLEAEIFSDIGKEQAWALRKKIEWIFNSHLDLRELYSFMERDRKLKEVRDRLYGLKPYNYSTVFEGVIKSIIQQQISLIGSMYIIARLINRFGEKVKIGKDVFYEFPSAESLAFAPLERLKECGLSKQKAGYIKEFSRIVAQHDFDPEVIKRAPVKEGIEILTKIRGVGRWTAELVMVTSTDHKDVLPAGDLGVRRAVSNFACKHLMQEEEVRKFTERWGRFKALIAYYLICEEKAKD